jgi:hypothetical protein
MIAWREILASFCFCAVLSGCNTNPDLPLVFYQATTVGITANASPAQASPEISLGYRDTDVAVVPVTANGQPIRAKNPNPNTNGKGKYEDALSVFGQFQVDTAAGPSTSIGLGKFFATGLAAEQLANGFKYRVGGMPIALPRTGAVNQ